MDINENADTARKKLEEAKLRKARRENRDHAEEKRRDLRRTIIIGKLFIKHFPITMGFDPGRSETEDAAEFEVLDNCLEAFAEAFRAYQEIEDKMTP